MPQNLEAERLLLGAIFAKNELIYEVMQVVEQRDFFDPGHGELFILLIDVINSGRHASPLSVMHDFGQDRDIGGVTAAAYLRELDDEAPPGNRKIAVSLANTVHDLAVSRRCISVCEELAAEFRSAPVTFTAHEQKERLGKALVDVISSSRDTGARHVGELAAQVVDRIDKASREEAQGGVSLPITALQDLLGLLMPGRTYALAGTPGSGKSALAQQIGEWVGTTPDPANPERNMVCLLCEAEMSDEEVAERSIAARTRFTSETLERGIFNPGDFDRLMEAANGLKKCELYVDAQPAPTAQDIRWKATAMKATRGLHLLIVDHALLIKSANPRATETEAINDTLITLKVTAKELGIPVLILTQFFGEALRAIAQWPHRRPRKGDLHQTAAFDRHMDGIVIIHRDEAILAENEPSPEEEFKNKKYKPDWEARLMGGEGKAMLYLGKRRGGKGYGSRPLWFDAEITRFSDSKPRSIARKESAPAAFDFGGTDPS